MKKLFYGLVMVLLCNSVANADTTYLTSTTNNSNNNNCCSSTCTCSTCNCAPAQIKYVYFQSSQRQQPDCDYKPVVITKEPDFVIRSKPPFEPKFALGIDYTGSKLYYDKNISGMNGNKIFSNEFNTFALTMGGKFTKNFGLEMYMQQSEREKRTSVFGTSKTDFFSFGLDSIFYAPLSDDFNLLATLGIGEYEFNHSLYTNGNMKSLDTDSFGFRFGLGAEYNLTDHIALRTMGRYVLPTEDDVKNILEFSLGLRFYI